MTLVIVGNTVVDIILPGLTSLPQWPAHTEFTAQNLLLFEQPPIITVGGNGGNAAYVAARCRAAVRFYGNHGDDTLGQLATGWLKSAGCTAAPALPGARTPLNVTAANAQMQRATFFFAGSTPPLPPADLEAAGVLVTGWPHHPAGELATRLQSWRSRRILTALDVGPFLHKPPSLAALRPVIDSLDLLLANEHEILTLTGTSDVPGALHKLRQVFAGGIIVKRGARGATWLSAADDMAQDFPGQPIRAVNTVGAGDTFNGALLASLLKEHSTAIAIDQAIRASASVVASDRGVLGLVVPSALTN